MEFFMENNNTIASLESKVDHLETELSYIEELLTRCGFPEGITSLKAAALELCSEMGPWIF